MPIFEITKPIQTILRVKCKSKAEAEIWASKIVATIENDKRALRSKKIVFFEADSVKIETKIEEIRNLDDY